MRLRYVRSALRSAVDCLRVGAVAIWPESLAPSRRCRVQLVPRRPRGSDQEKKLARGGEPGDPKCLGPLMRAVLVHTEPDVAGSRRLAEVNLW